jgi:hypothetical protein
MQDEFGDCLVPKRFWGDYQLGEWTYRLRLMLKDKKLAVNHFEALESMSFPWAIPVVSLFLAFQISHSATLGSGAGPKWWGNGGSGLAFALAV